MGTNMNFKSYGNNPPESGGGGRPPADMALARQTSIYSLTFDELQNTMGGVGKDYFGSMNMDELLRNIWGAEEIQGLPSSSGPHDGGAGAPGGGYLQRQGSVTLPRTLSTKTVDEVWKDISNLPQRQQTLGEMTLEEFLVRAGVVREDLQPDNGGFLNPPNTNGLGLGFQQMGTNIQFTNSNTNNQIALQPPNLPLNVNQQAQLFPKQAAMAYACQMGSPGMRGGIVGMSSPGINGNSPGNQLSSDGIGRSNGDTSSVSPVPYAFNGGLRGRRSGTVEKVVERRQRRMIKNRESAARSRARKQAYTMELEAEVAKLKEDNEGLRKKQEEIMEMQKKQVVEMMEMQRGGKKQCLRRTQTGPW